MVYRGSGFDKVVEEGLKIKLSNTTEGFDYFEKSKRNN